MFRRVFGHLPQFVRDPILGAAKVVRTRAFAIPDPEDDLARLCRSHPPAAFLDIGANVGQTVHKLHRRLSGIPIHCFEPTPASVEQLRRAVAKIQNVHVHAVALADQVGTLPFFLNRNSETNSLLENDTANTTALGSMTAHTGTIEVPVTTLDAWLPQHVPAGDVVVKADVQGAELKLIEGATQSLRSRVSVFYTEVSLAELYVGQGDLFSIHAALTRDLPFVLYQIYRTRSDGTGRALWADAMWVRKDLISPSHRQNGGQ